MSTTIIEACWNTIGVNGDQSCDKLRRHVHCRNCEVYAAAAQQNLQRPVGGDYQKEWAEHFRQAASDNQQQDTSCLVFRIGREWLSLPTRMFVAVAPIARPHRLPHRAARGLSGIVNVGGTLYPCMSLADLLGIDESEGEAVTHRHTFARLLLAQWEDQAYALPVVDLHGLLRYASGSVQAPAATINKGLSRFLSGVISHQDMRIGVLDEALIGYQLARTLR
ncbi:chemotaxis-related protein WspD [Duganella sp. SG902]|uniref:chemotaxis protein CheW n=1 Tax=Duganella sp. SG902 TaxID=2587016 RepID=UPI00159E5EF0|nr:chemotaxis protein CheW [Duganella sp. SG902]NVM80095.1 chemotaxis-related protein WspD [Duganella sp. SG902]